MSRVQGVEILQMFTYCQMVVFFHSETDRAMYSTKEKKKRCVPALKRAC
ncbi:hypothetical protein PS900_03442 [Pseudomonas fluorescens]|uniref:Uncharacterized protein n=1 Tax=Pseudomonas fluorescens TaxID=294 RepID=A0A8H2P2J4_PSEFL|nr:hypothetical protein PS900_03442 [Pseudomonas fluorescens]